MTILSLLEIIASILPLKVKNCDSIAVFAHSLCQLQKDGAIFYKIKEDGTYKIYYNMREVFYNKYEIEADNKKQIMTGLIYSIDIKYLLRGETDGMDRKFKTGN